MCPCTWLYLYSSRSNINLYKCMQKCSTFCIELCAILMYSHAQLFMSAGGCTQHLVFWDGKYAWNWFCTGSVSHVQKPYRNLDTAKPYTLQVYSLWAHYCKTNLDQTRMYAMRSCAFCVVLQSYTILLKPKCAEKRYSKAT